MFQVHCYYDFALACYKFITATILVRLHFALVPFHSALDHIHSLHFAPNWCRSYQFPFFMANPKIKTLYSMVDDDDSKSGLSSKSRWVFQEDEDPSKIEDFDANDDREGGIFALYSLVCWNAKVSLLPSQLSSNA
ncbi:hypothetical protein RJT34_16711 [Clitoria ternatea]|uniref:Uncharacterized protein n=1 Tax=Clitoria ternatea TaxID=43366 RepID=A0AAN9J982_CLITE